MLRIALALCLAATPSPAKDQRKFIAFDGWTQDSRFVVFTLTTEWAATEAGDGGKAVETWVVDGRTGATAKYQAGKPDKKAKDVLSAEALAEWKKAHPLAPVVPSKTSPDKAATARIDLVADDGKGSWAGAGYAFGCQGEDCMMMQGKLTFSVEKAGKTYRGAGWEESSAGNLRGAVVPYWSPDGHRVAWALERGYAMMNDFGYGKVFVSAASVRTEVVAAKDLSPDAAIDALEKAGVYVTKTGPAQKAREKSVVYFAKGFDAEAKAAAAAVPGGATTEPLSWKAESDLVIALGATAK